MNSREQRARAALSKLGPNPRPEELRAVSAAHSVGVDTLRRMAEDNGATPGWLEHAEVGPTGVELEGRP
jgi:hypothetical protein